MIKWTLFNNGVGLIIKKISRRVIVAITKLLEVDNSPVNACWLLVVFSFDDISDAGVGSKWITLIILK